MTPMMDYLRRGIRSRPTFVEKAVGTGLAIAIPTALRWLLVGTSYGAHFALFFPAILIIAILIGWRPAAFTTIAGGIVVVALFWPPEYVMLNRQPFLVLLIYALSAATMIAIGQLLRDAMLAIEAQARQSEAFNRELQHRTKNALQMMRALASQASKATDPGEFYATLGGRLAALAKANELLRFGALETCDMEALVRAAIAPFSSRQIAFSGPTCCVSRNGCTPLMMALHELGTNASKYGALSVESGRVEITWRVTEPPDGPVEVCWRESGGPAVSEPTHRGIGARLLAPTGGMRQVDLRYHSHGVACELTVEQA